MSNWERLTLGVIMVAGVFGVSLGVGYGFAHLIAECATR